MRGRDYRRQPSWSVDGNSAEPHNIWGVPLPPDDWEETAALETGH
jgi:hypothetical protein